MACLAEGIVRIAFELAAQCDLQTLKRTVSLPQNVNYGLKSSFVLAFLESLSELAPALPPPHTDDRKFEDVVKEVQQASVLVLTY